MTDAATRGELCALTGLCAAVFAASCLFFFSTPYFLDSFGYVAWIEEWRRGGELPSTYRYANTLLYYFPVSLFGELGLKIVGVAVTTALTATYYAMVRRDFSRVAAAAAAALFFTAPPVVITATHLKEDLTSLLFFSASILLIRPGGGVVSIALAGVAYGLSLLFKEVMLGAAPFVIAYLCLRRGRVEQYSDLFDFRRWRSSSPALLTFLLGTAVAVFAVSPTRIQDYSMMASSPYMGQFLGLFSAQQAQGLHYWSEAMLHLHPWYVLLVGFFVADLGKRPPVQALYLLVAVALLLFLANVSVVRMRHYVPVIFFLAPVLFEGARSVFELAFGLSAREVAVSPWPPAFALLLCAVFAVAHLVYVYPTIDYRLRYPPSRGFLEPLATLLPEDALLLGMDNCPIAAHVTGLSCENHRPDLDPTSAEQYARAVSAEVARRPVYLLPDFFNYDRAGHLRHAFGGQFASRPSYSGWWEPYHAMTYGIGLEEAIERELLRRPGCVASERTTTRERVSADLTLDETVIRYRCGAARTGQFAIASHAGYAVPLRRSSVSKLEAR